MKSKLKKWVFGSVTGLFISGILINALWDFIKSSTGIGLVFLVRIATLGFSKLNDNIYKEIAKGFREESSLQVYLMVSGLFLGFVIMTVFSLLLIKKKILKDKDDTENKTDKEGFSMIFLKSRISSYVLSAYIIFASTILLFDLARTVYINKSIAYYQQLLAVVAPVIDDSKYEIFNSQFAQIQNQAGYVRVIDQLEEIARSNQFTLPIRPSLL